MSKRSRSKTNIPIHRESIFCIRSPVLCILSSLSLGDAQHAHPAQLATQSHLPSSDFPTVCALPFFVPLCLCGQYQLCKTNPISETQKSTEHLMAQTLTSILYAPGFEKNKPKQSQFIASKPLAKPDPTPCDIRHPTYACPLGEIRKTNPTCPAVATSESGFARPQTAPRWPAGLRRSGRNKFLAIVAGMPHNGLDTVENDHKVSAENSIKEIQE